MTIGAARHELEVEKREVVNQLKNGPFAPFPGHRVSPNETTGLQLVQDLCERPAVLQPRFQRQLFAR